MTQKKSPDDFIKGFTTTLETYFLHKAPALPKDIKELIVKYGPWLVLIGLIFSIPAVLAVFGLGAVLSPLLLLAGPRLGAGFTVAWIFLAASLVLEAFALPHLFKRAKKGWTLMYYATLLGVIENILMFNIAGLLIGSILSLYILFQIREYYK